ncbi:MAG: TetR/AcrR family transcriptional regulator [Gemmatimonadales bacterium]|nr:TetR/AcrR family transcriptional regulator [Gemmatimonadales bacterium]
MPRPRLFLESDAVAAVLEVFWRDGYEGASVQALCEAAGVQKGSLYAAFGDKRALFLRALAAYQATMLDAVRARLAGEAPAAERLARWLGGVVRGQCEAGERRGCLVVNTAIELAPRDAEVAALVRAHDSALEAVLREVVQAGIADGSLRAGLDARQSARFLLTTLHGLAVGARAGHGRAWLDGGVTLALAALRAP